MCSDFRSTNSRPSDLSSGDPVCYSCQMIILDVISVSTFISSDYSKQLRKTECTRRSYFDDSNEFFEEVKIRIMSINGQVL